MLVLLLLPSSCDLNIKHRRKISPRAPSPGAILGPHQPPYLGGGTAAGMEGPPPMDPLCPRGPPVAHPHWTGLFLSLSLPIPQCFPHLCLFKEGDIYLTLCGFAPAGLRKGAISPKVIIWFGGLQGLLLLSWREEIGNVWAYQKQFALQLCLRGRKKPFLLQHRDSWLSAHGAVAE